MVVELKPVLERLAKAALATRVDETFEEDGVRYVMQGGERVQVWPMPRALHIITWLLFAATIFENDAIIVL